MSIGIATTVIGGANLVSAKEKFTDLGSVLWAENAVYYLSDRGIINGYGNGYFGATDHITRGQAAVMLVRELYPNETSSTKLTFPDVAEDSYYYNAIAVAVERGIFNGNPDGTFAPDAPISRAATAKILAVAYGLDGTKGNFSDLNQAEWAREYVNALASNHITTGYADYTFKPNHPISRAEFTVLFARVLNEGFRTAPDFSNPNYYYEYIVSEIAAEAAKEKTTAEKVTYVYNALAKHIEYEHRGLNVRESHTGYGAIVNGLAYCDGYSEAMIAVLKRLNIHAVEVVSWPMDHSWIMIHIDGEYYHADLTWDDNSDGVSYNYFLLSDHEMIKADHYDWGLNNYFNSIDIYATSDKYLYLQDEKLKDDRDYKPLAYDSGYFYYHDTEGYMNSPNYGTIMKVSFDHSSVEVLPGLKFTHDVFKGDEWYYGFNSDHVEETYEVYKFKLDGEMHLIQAGEGWINSTGTDLETGMFQFRLSGQEGYNKIQFE